MAKNLKGLDNHYGKWRYRFTAKGIRTTVVTDLEATPANRDAAAALLQDHKMRLVLGLPEPVEAIPFEAKPATGLKRGSSLSTVKSPRPQDGCRSVSRAGGRSLASERSNEVTAADVVGYMTWRRETNVKEVTLRKDMLAARQVIRFWLAAYLDRCRSDPRNPDSF